MDAYFKWVKRQVAVKLLTGGRKWRKIRSCAVERIIKKRTKTEMVQHNKKYIGRENIQLKTNYEPLRL